MGVDRPNLKEIVQRSDADLIQHAEQQRVDRQRQSDQRGDVDVVEESVLSERIFESNSNRLSRMEKFV